MNEQKVRDCNRWRYVGVTECNNCDKHDACWNEEETEEEIKFNAILSKNCIARKIKTYKEDGDGYIPADYIIERLKEIEKFLGTSNQPSVEGIIESKMNI